MKKIQFMLSVVFWALVFAGIFSCTAQAQTVAWEEESLLSPVNASGYPRLAMLEDGTLLLTSEGLLCKSSDGGENWVRENPKFMGASASVVSKNGITHLLSRENWQLFVLSDDRIMLAYRARTASYKADVKSYTKGEFYTSIRVIYSSDGAKTFGNEEILVENTANAFNGYWEPFIIQIDERTLALYYANDLDGVTLGAQQNICYVTYDLETETWDKTQRVAINGISRSSRDGMPVVTQLSDGSFAMVFEAFDYNRRSYNGVYGQSPFVISLSRSADGKNWSTPVPIAAPENITAGYTCAAPYITTLGDGRVSVSYMCNEDYIGIPSEDSVQNSNMDVIVSKKPMTLDSVIVATSGGASPSFEKAENPITQVRNGFQIWCCLAYLDGRLYAACSSGTNDGSESAKLKLRRADLRSATTFDLNWDGKINFADVCFELWSVTSQPELSEAYHLDFNRDGILSAADVLLVLRQVLLRIK